MAGKPQLRNRQQQKAPEQKQQGFEHEHGGMEYSGAVYLSLEHGNLSSGIRPLKEHEQDYEKSIHLYSAGYGAGSAPDEHEQHGEGFGGDGEIPLGDGIETRGSGRGSLKQGGHDLLPRIEGRKAAPGLESQIESCGEHQQSSGHEKNDLAVQAQLLLLDHGSAGGVPQYHESEAPENHQGHYSQTHRGICSVALQVVRK